MTGRPEFSNVVRHILKTKCKSLMIGRNKKFHGLFDTKLKRDEIQAKINFRGNTLSKDVQLILRKQNLTEIHQAFTLICIYNDSTLIFRSNFNNKSNTNAIVKSLL